MSRLIYHITTRLAWAAAQETGAYRADSLASQGFIHCSTSDQVVRVANAFYRGQSGLVLLEIDSSVLKPDVRWEPGTDKADELFPHIYGVIDVDAVLRVLDFPAEAQGTFELPLP